MAEGFHLSRFGFRILGEARQFGHCPTTNRLQSVKPKVTRLFCALHGHRPPAARAFWGIGEVRIIGANLAGRQVLRLGPSSASARALPISAASPAAAAEVMKRRRLCAIGMVDPLVAGPAYAFNSRLISSRKRQSVYSAMSLSGPVLIRPDS